LFSGVPDSGTFARALGVHFLLAVIYSLVIAAAVFRLRPLLAVTVAGVVGLGIYALNFIVFRFVFGYPPVNEIPTAVIHIAFALTVAGAYKALSVHKIAPTGDEIE
jgi:hypothetical protein